MSTSLTTSKRKFQKILDNLTTASRSKPPVQSIQQAAVAPGPTPLCDAPPTKRSRVSQDGDGITDGFETTRLPPAVSLRRTAVRDINEGKVSRAGTVRLVDSLATKKSKVTASPTIWNTPNYSPWSQEQFLKRLKTFADVKLWSPKPIKLNEMEWSKRGWICENKNKVACNGGCEARLVIGLRPRRKDADGNEIEGSEDFLVDIEEELVNYYTDLIINGHEDHCLWRKRGCKDDIYRIPSSKLDPSQSSFQKRYLSLLSISNELPTSSLADIPGYRIEELVQLVPQSFIESCQHPETCTAVPEINGKPSSELNATSFVYAMYGWHGTVCERLNLIQCYYCFARVGLWLYKSQESNLIENNETDTTRNPQVTTSLRLKLDLANAHREHCPWRNSATQGNTVKGGAWDGLEGWRTTMKLLEGLQRTSMRKDRPKSLLSEAENKVTPVSVVDSSREKTGGYRNSEEATQKGSESKYEAFSAEQCEFDKTNHGSSPPSIKETEMEDRKQLSRLRRLTSKMFPSKKKSFQSMRSARSGKRSDAGDATTDGDSVVFL